MEIKELKQLVRQGEGEQLEFKRKVAHPEKIVREIVAFANSKGGDLLIGIDDNGSIPGLKFVEEEIFVLNRAIDTLIRPKVDYSYDIIHLDEDEELSVVHYTIPVSTRRPHYALPHKNTRWGKAYVRINDKSIQASREVREIIKRKSKTSVKPFHFGQKEKQLMHYLNEHEAITLPEYMEVANIPQGVASKTLVTLAVAGVIEVLPSDKADHFKARVHLEA